MAIDPQLGKQLADLGGFALFLLVVVVAGVGLFKQWVVMGWTYRQERDARIASENREEKTVEAIEKLTRAVTRERARSPRAEPPDGS